MGGFEEEGEGKKRCWIHWRGEFCPLELDSALQAVSAQCCCCHVELGFSMEVKKMTTSLPPNTTSSLPFPPALHPSGYFLIPNFNASLLAPHLGLVTPKLSTGSGSIKGCGAPASTKGKRGAIGLLDPCCSLPSLHQPGHILWFIPGAERTKFQHRS